jgi:peroxiredoxin
MTEEIFARVRSHKFHPIKDGFTYDRSLGEQGVADPDDNDWHVRTVAVRDLVRTGTDAATSLIRALNDENPHVRQIATMVLGILRVNEAVNQMEKMLIEDPDEVVRAQLAKSLGQIGSQSSLKLLDNVQHSDTSGDVQHQAVLAVYAIRNGFQATSELAQAYKDLDVRNYNTDVVGHKAADFELPDSDGKLRRLSDMLGEKPVLLIWIFADWCPVCHREFQELIETRRNFEEKGIRVLTLECHDEYPVRVMAGKELEPDYWFADEPFLKAYTNKIWWHHLADRAGGVGIQYGVQPMAFTVHAEWINRPAVVIIDKDETVRFAYHGTFWGDRPSIHEILKMIETENYNFVSPKRLGKG